MATITPTNFGRDNQLRTRMWVTMLLLGGVYGLFIWVLWGLGYTPWLVAVGLLVLVQLWLSDKMVLYAMRAKVVSESEFPRLHAMVGELAQAAGIPKPKVAVAQMGAPNAFATGRSVKGATVAVTSGLMDLLDERQMRAVLAHEISHIRTRDVVVMTYASFFSMVAATLMSWLFWSSLFGGMGRRRNDNSGNVLMLVYLVTIVVWFVSQLLVAALSRYREYAADRGAAVLTREPLALASALQRIHGGLTGVPRTDLRKAESASAFFIMPAVGDGFASLFSTHPSMERRVLRLQEMERQLNQRG
jgi:heat shock protein HtpX